MAQICVKNARTHMHARRYSEPTRAVAGELEPLREGVGKYLRPGAGGEPTLSKAGGGDTAAVPPPKKAKTSGGFGSFSGW